MTTMEKTISAIRIATLAALTFTAAFCIFSEPLETYGMANWLLAFAVSKAIGAAALLAIAKVYPRWRKADRAVAALDRWCSRGIEQS